jgi:phosphoglycolate phosphatase
MAQNAGCPSVGVSYGAHDGGELVACHPLTIAPSVEALHRWLIEHA